MLVGQSFWSVNNFGCQHFRSVNIFWVKILWGSKFVWGTFFGRSILFGGLKMFRVIIFGGSTFFGGQYFWRVNIFEWETFFEDPHLLGVKQNSKFVWVKMLGGQNLKLLKFDYISHSNNYDSTLIGEIYRKT